MYAIFVFFLLRPKASAYFTHSDTVPNQKLGKWLKYYGPILQLKI
jgi:hypothetical protein